MVPTDASRVIAAHGHPVEAGTIVLLVVLFVVVAGGIIALGWRSQAKPSPEIETPSRAAWRMGTPPRRSESAPAWTP
jgi:hypothetical protein